MGLKEFKIQFDNPLATYYPNDTVTGNIILSLDSTKKIRGIKLNIKGAADTYWTESRSVTDSDGKSSTETVSYTGHEEYFKAQFYVLGSGSGSEVELPAGTHTYPFNYVLPPNLPSSFESAIGHIRYTAKAILDRPWKFDQETKIAFTVISHLDLNQQAGASESVQLEKNKTFCCLCCGSPPLSINICLPVKGYVPGQSIPVKVNVENESGITVDKVKLKLDKIVTYFTTSRSDKNVSELTISEVSKGPVAGNETTSYLQNLDVPPLPPSNLQNCGIIDLEYKLRIEGCVSGCYRNLRAATPIFIGTVPLSNYQMPQPPAYPTPEYLPKPQEAYQGTYPPNPAPSAPEPPPDYNHIGFYSNLVPPSYEESMYRSKSLRDRDESEYVIGAGDQFAPRYPVYNFKLTQ